MIIRSEREPDMPAIHAVNAAAFGRTAEADLVDQLRRDGVVVASLVAEDAGAIVGHILFSRLVIEVAGTSVHAVALAPMAVMPSRQRQGIGTALVRAGLDACRAQGETIAIVLGYPEFYPRFGFSTALTARLESKYRGPAFHALELVPAALAGVEGAVRYPSAFGA